VKQLIMILGFVVVFASACGTAETEPELTVEPTIAESPTPNEVLVTPDATRMNNALPPTWTPTHTPTVTNTPTVTPTFTVTPSVTPIDTDLLCESFRYDVSLIDNETFGEDDTVSVTYGIDSTYHYAFVAVVLEHDELEDIIGDVLPGGSDYTSTFTVSDFPLSGEWQYRTGVFLVNGDEMLCRQSGTFTITDGSVRAEQPQPLIPTAMAVPSITPQPDPTEAQCYLFCPE